MASGQSTHASNNHKMHCQPEAGMHIVNYKHMIWHVCQRLTSRIIIKSRFHSMPVKGIGSCRKLCSKTCSNAENTPSVTLSNPCFSTNMTLWQRISDASDLSKLLISMPLGGAAMDRPLPCQQLFLQNPLPHVGLRWATKPTTNRLQCAISKQKPIRKQTCTFYITAWYIYIYIYIYIY